MGEPRIALMFVGKHARPDKDYFFRALSNTCWGDGQASMSEIECTPFTMHQTFDKNRATYGNKLQVYEKRSSDGAPKYVYIRNDFFEQRCLSYSFNGVVTWRDAWFANDDILWEPCYFDHGMHEIDRGFVGADKYPRPVAFRNKRTGGYLTIINGNIRVTPDPSYWVMHKMDDAFTPGQAAEAVFGGAVLVAGTAVVAYAAGVVAVAGSAALYAVGGTWAAAAMAAVSEVILGANAAQIAIVGTGVAGTGLTYTQLLDFFTREDLDTLVDSEDPKNYVW